MNLLFHPGELEGVRLVEPVRHGDSRGFFARAWCQREFEREGLNSRWVQGSFSVTRRAGTLRGLHYQDAAVAEVKLVRCARGAVYDVLLDLRRASPTYGQWMAAELTEQNCTMLYVPAGVAHGFQTLEDDCEVVYQMSAYYAPEFARGVRYDDPAFGIRWPLEVTVISGKDAQWPDYQR